MHHLKRKRRRKLLALFAVLLGSCAVAICLLLLPRVSLRERGVLQPAPKTPQLAKRSKPPKEESTTTFKPPVGYAIPILCYHDFREGGKHAYWAIPPKRFETHLQMLTAMGFTFLKMSEAVELMQGRWNKPIPRRPIVITIDDGFRSAYTVAYPLLRKYKAKATLFVYTNAIGKFGLSWDQLREMIQSGIVEVASHTVSHMHPKRLRKLSRDAYRERLAYEFTTSKKILEENLGITVNGLAYTGGVADTVAVEMAREAGYRWAVKIAPLPMTAQTNLYLIPRYGISRQTTTMVLKAWLSQPRYGVVCSSLP